MLDTGVSSGCCVCYMVNSGGKAWPCRCRRHSAPASDASGMKAIMPRSQCDWSLSLHLWSCYMFTLPALRPLWSWINPQMWLTFWSFVATLQNTLWYMWPQYQTAKTVTKFLWQGYISSFRALANLLSDWGANFESNIIREICNLMSIWKFRTSHYHAQTNGQVVWAHQMLLQMIGKLSKDWKVSWLKHLPELVHSYNSMRLASTGYSYHYLIFGCWPCLPINFYFPRIRDTKKHQHVDHYIPSLCEGLWKAFKEAQVQSTSQAERQQHYYNRKANVILLELSDLALAKADTYRGRMKLKGLVGRGTIQSGTLGCRRSPFLPHEESVDRMLTRSPPKLTFSHHPYRGDFSPYGCAG